MSGRLVDRRLVHDYRTGIRHWNAPAPGGELRWFRDCVELLREHLLYRYGPQPPNDDPRCWLATYPEFWQTPRAEDFGPLIRPGDIDPSARVWCPGEITRRNLESYRAMIEAQYERMCLYCGRSEHELDGVGWHLDHYVPLSRGGIDERFNVVLACARCNLRKADKIWAPGQSVGSCNRMAWQQLPLELPKAV